MVSRQIRKLETCVGTASLERGARGATPTARGELLLPHARRVLEAHDAAGAELDGPSLGGTLRFGRAEDLDGPSAPVDALGRLLRESLASPGTRPLRAQDDARDG